MNNKTKSIAFSAFLITLLTSSITYATLSPLTPPPVGGYNSGSNSILDPGCAPNTTDCFVNLPSGGSVTADNGLTASGSNVQLGGTLLQDTVIDQAGYNLFTKRSINTYNGEPGSYEFGFGNATSLGGFLNGVGNYALATIDAVPTLTSYVFNGIGQGGELGVAPFIGEMLIDSTTGNTLSSKMIAFGDQELILSSTRESIGDSSGINIRSNSLQFDFSNSGVWSSYAFPRTDGLVNQVLTTDGAGQLSWQNGGGGSGWLLTGNAGTTAGTNFVGTTDAQDLVFKTDNNELMRMTASGNIGIGTNNPLFGFHVQDTSIAMAQSYSSGNSANLFMFDNTLMPGVEGLDYKREWDSGNKSIEIDLTNADLTKGYMSILARDTTILNDTEIGLFPDLFRIRTQTTTPSNKLFSVISDIRNPYNLWQDGSFAYNDDNFQNDTPGTEQNMFYFNYGDHDGLGTAQTKRAIRLGSVVNDEWDINSANVGDRSIGIGFGGGSAGNYATGIQSISIGDDSAALGDGSVAIQGGAFGIGSFAIRGAAIGDASISIGGRAEGNGSLAFGSSGISFSTQEVSFMSGTSYTPIGGVNTWDPADRLFNIGKGSSDAFTILKNGQTGIAIDNFEANSNGNIFQVGDGSTGIIGYVDNGTGNWVAVSDERKKDNITDLTYGLNELIQLRPTSFNYKRNNEHTIGFLAQQVLPIIPEAVYGTESEGYGMSYATLTPVIVKAIQELNLKVDLLSMNAGSTSTDIFSSLKNWLADAGNGIGLLVTKIIKSEKVETKELCVDDVCVTRDQFRAMVQQSTVEQPPDTVIITPDVESNHEIVDPNIDSGNTTTTSTTDI